MAVTTEKSTQCANIDARTLVNVDENCSKVRIKRFSFTQGAAAGDATSTATLVYLPAGRIRVLADQSRLTWSAFGASRVLDVGYAAYTAEAGTTTSAAPAAFDDDIDVSTAGTANLGSDITSADKTQYFASRNGIVVKAVVAGGTIPVGATLSGYILYSVE